MTKDKLLLKRLKKILSNPLIDNGLTRAAIFHSATSEPEKQKPYLDLRVKIKEVLSEL